MTPKRTRHKVEFGDFQTPLSLAGEVCDLLTRIGCSPSSILEPTCGEGAFLRASLRSFPEAIAVRGYDCNPTHVQTAQLAVSEYPKARVEDGDFFDVDWVDILSELFDPILVIGNPPWVTNATVGSLGGTNLPEKTNIDGLRGIDALTGRANFDISEWMLRETVRWLACRIATMAVLCKTAVARKILSFCWAKDISIDSAALYGINTVETFGASVDACLFVVQFRPDSYATECDVYDTLASAMPSSRFGKAEDVLAADLDRYSALSFLYSHGLVGWRSGVKHDCSRVFELSMNQGVLVNGLGEHVCIENDVIYPLLKSSDIAHAREPRKSLVVPHRSMEESPSELACRAPAAWEYLLSHSDLLSKRKSSVYRKRPPFSIFGIGCYSLTDWKVAISGLYKELRFMVVGPYQGRPVVVDDTCYVFPCDSQEECEFLYELVTSPTAMEFWSSLVFWDTKRPVTAKLLNMLDLAVLAKHLDVWTPTARRLAERQIVGYSDQNHQMTLFRESAAKYRET